MAVSLVYSSNGLTPKVQLGATLFANYCAIYSNRHNEASAFEDAGAARVRIVNNVRLHLSGWESRQTIAGHGKVRYGAMLDRGVLRAKWNSLKI